MPYTPEQRRQLHTKQSKLQVSIGEPKLNELIEGVPVLRSTGEGLVEYIRYKGELYKQVFTLVSGEKSIPIEYAKLVHSHNIEWHDMILENNWVAHGSSFSTPSYAKDDNGFVYLRGVVKDGDNRDDDITSLPAGYIPSEQRLMMGITYGNDQCRITIRTDGDIDGPDSPVGDGGMSTNWVSFDGLFFHL